MGDLGPTELRLMQGLAQQVTALRPELVNGDATVGELAWVWAKDFDALNQFWRHRLWFVDGRLAAWAWVYLPYRVPRSDGKFLEVKAANLIWQVHPDRPELLTEILDWYDDVAGDVDRLLTVQAADVQARASVAAHGYAFDAETGSDNGFWVQFNVRELADVPDPVLPKGFRFLAAEDVSVADAVKAHRDAWYPSSFTEAAFERVRRHKPAPKLVRQRTRDESRLNAVTRKTLIRLAKRWTALNAEIKDYDQDLTDLVTATAPALLTLPAVGVDTAGALLVSVGDNPDRLESEATFAALCGVAPLPASSGRTQRHRLNRGPAPSSRRSNSPDKYVSSPPRSASPRSRSYRHPFTCRVVHEGRPRRGRGIRSTRDPASVQGTNHRVSSEGDGTR